MSEVYRTDWKGIGIALVLLGSGATFGAFVIAPLEMVKGDYVGAQYLLAAAFGWLFIVAGSLAIGALRIFQWLRRNYIRFSLRSLLIATTLVAVVLGLAVSVGRL